MLLPLIKLDRRAYLALLSVPSGSLHLDFFQSRVN
jgi:hypothetical protein